jgi:hypothetical protein
MSMDPALYESQYRGIKVQDARLGLLANIDISKYISGWRQTNFDQYMKLMSIIAGWLGLRGPSLVPPIFRIPGKSIDPDEVFYKESIRRAYEGRAAPEEIVDALRLSFLAGLFKFPVSAQAYADTWFGLDCNTFVGNYCGISPSTSIAAYATGYPAGPLSGATPDLFVSRDPVPLAPLTALDDIGPGTVVASYAPGNPDKNGNFWRHIALVQSFDIVIGVGGARTGGWLVLAEWGGKGDASNHITTRAQKRVVEYKVPTPPYKTFLGFDGTFTIHKEDGTEAEVPVKRLFLDARKFDWFTVRGWHVYTGTGALVYGS